MTSQKANSQGAAVAKLLETRMGARQAIHAKMGLSAPDSVSQLWELYQSSADKSFDIHQVYLSLPRDKVLHQAPSVQQLPAVSLTNDFKAINANFDAYLAKETQPRKYIPLVFVAATPSTFAQYMQLQACADLILAFQENHKVAAQNLLKMHVNEELKPLFNSIIMSTIFSFVISHC